MSKQAKKRPKPVPCERWGIYDKDGYFLLQTPSTDVANSYLIGGRFKRRVRIVPVVAKAKRRKGAK